MDTGYDLQHLLQEARRHWLMPGEVLFILQNHDPGMIRQHVHQMPTGGSLFLFNRNNVPSFRGDGHKWRKKPHKNSVNEAHEKLKVLNVEALACYYAKREDNPNFRRRSYWIRLVTREWTSGGKPSHWMDLCRIQKCCPSGTTTGPAPVKPLVKIVKLSFTPRLFSRTHLLASLQEMKPRAHERSIEGDQTHCLHFYTSAESDIDSS